MTDFIYAGWMDELYLWRHHNPATGATITRPMVCDWGWDDDDINPVPQPPVDFPVPAVFRFNPDK